MSGDYDCPDCGPECDCDGFERYEPDHDEERLHEQGCCMGTECLHPDPYHLAYECFDAEMARAYHEEHLTWRQRIARRLAEALDRDARGRKAFACAALATASIMAMGRRR